MAWGGHRAMGGGMMGVGDPGRESFGEPIEQVWQPQPVSRPHSAHLDGSAMAENSQGQSLQPPSPSQSTQAKLLQRAKGGDGKAIAALIQQGLARQGFTVEGDRQGQTLTLWIQGSTLPPQRAMVAYLEQGLIRLGVTTLREVYVYGSTPEQGQSWRQVVILPAPQGPEFIPAPPASPPSADPDGPDTVALINAPLSELPDLVARYRRPQGTPGSDGAMVSDRPLAIAPVAAGSLAGANAGDINPADHLGAIAAHLSRPGLPVQASLCHGQLCLTLPATRTNGPLKTLAYLYTQLAAADLNAWGLGDGQPYQVRGVQGKRVVWRRQAPLPCQDALTATNTDLFSFHNRYSNTYLFPILLTVGGLLSASPLPRQLLWGIQVWFHEFGHASVSWLAGRQAIPLPIGLTISSLNRSPWVYGGVLVLLLLLYWSGWREKKYWPRILAVGFMVLQFILTWLTPAHIYEMWMTFGGIGGEFYLATLLIVSFYFPFPAYWRWEFYRYPAVLAAAFCLWGQVGLWQAIAQGRANIPWGGLWGGESTGDMNRLVYDYGWTQEQLINTYNGLGLVCIAAIAGVYFYRCWREHYRALWHWWLWGIHRWS